MFRYRVYENRATIVVPGMDRKYSVCFDLEYVEGPKWTFDPMCDTHDTWAEKTGNVRITFEPDTDRCRPCREDLDRPREYLMTVERGREFFKLVTSRDEPPQYWFALDMASYMSKH